MADQVKITDNTSELVNNINKSTDLALNLMVRAVEVEARPNTPRDKGDLRREVDTQRVSKGEYVARWNKEYAVYQEAGNNGSPIRNYTTPGTGPKFAENAVRKVVSDADIYFRKAGVFKS